MEAIKNHSEQNILLVVAGTSKRELECARKALADTEWSADMFMLRNEDTRIATERALKEILDQHTGLEMIVLVAPGNNTIEQALLLSRIAKERGILSVVVPESRTSKSAEYLEEQSLDMDKILAHTDCILLVPVEQTSTTRNSTLPYKECAQEKNFYQNVRDFLNLIRNVTEGFIYLDIADVTAVMKNAGFAYMGIGKVEGKTTVKRVAKIACTEFMPKEILAAAQGVLFQVTGCVDIGPEDVDSVANLLQQDMHPDGILVFGAAFDDDLRDEIRVEILAAGAEI